MAEQPIKDQLLLRLALYNFESAYPNPHTLWAVHQKYFKDLGMVV